MEGYCSHCNNLYIFDGKALAVIALEQVSKHEDLLTARPVEISDIEHLLDWVIGPSTSERYRELLGQKEDRRKQWEKLNFEFGGDRNK